LEKVLEMKKICKAFPGVVALDHVDLELHKGEVLALVGENGAGKSTMIKILSGMYKADEGEIVVDGVVYRHYSTREAIGLGIAVIYQELNYLNDLSIAENILLGRVPVRGLLRQVNYKKMNETAYGVMQQVSLGHRDPSEMVSNLSVAEKQLLEIARALSRNLLILVMDEPTSALNDLETEKLFKLIKDLRQKGIGIIYVSHRMEEIFRVTDRVEIMRDGKFITSMPVAETNTEKIVSHMVGRDIVDMFPFRNSEIGETVFSVSGLSTSYIKNVNFHVRRGEVVGLFGLMGSGRTELARCIVGIRQPDSGTIEMSGENFINRTPRESLRRRIAYVPAERKTEGVNLIASVKDNITLSNLDKILNRGILNLKKERVLAADWIKRLNIKTPEITTETETLSGGNQQKIVIAKSLNTDPSFMILNEPTRGIDVGAKVEIYNLINNFCQGGKAVLMISSELPEIMALSDRIYILCEGRITGELTKNQFTPDILLKYAIGEHRDD
jgi:ABC-type sugar transport system ATPase subunit